jgi:integrase
MANVYKRAGKWYVRYREPGGKDIRKSTKAKTKREAEYELAEIVRNIERGEYELKLQIQKVRFFEIADDFMAYSKAHKKSWVRDESCVRRFKEYFGDCLASKITRAKVEQYIADRKQSKSFLGETVSNATINRELACIKTIFKRAEEDGKVNHNPTRRVKMLIEDNVRDRIISEEEFELLLDASPEHHVPILVVAWETGMRKGEILGLTWDAIDLKNRFIVLKGDETKSGKGRRIPISDKLYDLLKGMPRKRGPVFTYRGKPIKRYVCASFKRSCEKAGIEDFRFHDLRHCFVTRMRRKGIPYRVIMQISGHSTMECFSRYDNIDDSDLLDAVQ